MHDLRKMTEIIQFIEDIYRKNSAVSSTYHDLCIKHANLSSLVVKVGCLTYFLSIVLYQSSSAISYICNGIVTPAMGLYFPLIEEYPSGSVQLTLLVIYNYFILFIDYFVLVAYDLMIFIVFVNMPMTSEIIQRRLIEMELVLLDDAVNKTNNGKHHLLDIICMHAKYNE